MGREDDEAELPDPDEDDPAIDARGEPGSAPRKKYGPSQQLTLLLADFHRRAKEMSREELDQAVDDLVDRILEVQLKVAPRGLRPEVRERLRQMIESDPVVSGMVQRLRDAAHRGPL